MFKKPRSRKQAMVLLCFLKCWIMTWGNGLLKCGSVACFRGVYNYFNFRLKSIVAKIKSNIKNERIKG